MTKVKYYLEDLISHEEENLLVAWMTTDNVKILGENNSKIVNTGKVYDYPRVATVDLLSGWTCPAADLCHSRVHNDNGHRTIEDLGKFRCYATKSEVQYEEVYNLHSRNFEISKDDRFSLALCYIIRKKRKNLVRFHSAGDFYGFSYFQKWIQVAKWNPSVVFFGYTKQATFYHWYLSHPVDNMRLVYSMGGKHDAYALKHNLPSCTVVTKDYLYHDAHTTIETLEGGDYLYTYRIEHKYGKTVKVETIQHTSSLYLEYGTFYNPIKERVENLSCMHDNDRSRVDDFERIMRQESFGIIFH